MRKKVAILSCIFGLLSGCSEMNNSDFFATKNITTDENLKNSILATILHMKFEDSYFLEKGQKFQLVSVEEKDDYIIDSKLEKQSYNLQNLVCEANIKKDSTTGVKKHKINAKKAYVKCYYLGNHKGKHIIFRRYSSGKSGEFTDIIFCSIKKEKVHIDDVLLLGDRALDGIIDCPHIGPDGNLYLKIRSSISTLANLAEISDKDVGEKLIQSSQDFWNTSECIYDLSTKKLNIISMNINFQNEFALDIKKILEEIFPNHGMTIYINADQMTEFLSKFKSVYEKISVSQKFVSK